MTVSWTVSGTVSRTVFGAAFVIGAWVVATIAASAQDAPEGRAGTTEQRTERGPVSALVRVEPDVVRIGDAITLTIEVRAERGVELLMPVFGASLERFTILEFVPRERIGDEGRTVSTQHYRLLAPASGHHAIPPITIEFVDRRPGQRTAPEDEDAYELLTERLAFTVESVVPDGAAGDLKPPLGPLEALTEEVAPRWPWATGASALVVGGGVLALLWWRLRERARRRSAYEIALGRLDALESRRRPDADAMDGFFVELSDLVRRYLEDRFALQAPELTTEEFLDVAAGSPDLTRDHRSFLQTFLRSADRVKFARHVPDAGAVESVLSAVRGFLRQTSHDESGAAPGPTLAARETTGA